MFVCLFLVCFIACGSGIVTKELDDIGGVQTHMQPSQDIVKDRMAYFERNNFTIDKNRHVLGKHFNISSFPSTPRRFKDINRTEFLYYAERGIPIIIEDGMRDWNGLNTWSFEYFQKEFPEEEAIGFSDYGHGKKQLKVKLKDINITKQMEHEHLLSFDKEVSESGEEGGADESRCRGTCRTTGWWGRRGG